jgi:hypothetical protein
MHSAQPRHRSRFTGADWVAGCAGLLAFVAGIAVLTLTQGVMAASVGVFLLGASGVAFVALAFLLVGESEDRDYGRRML